MELFYQIHPDEPKPFDTEIDQETTFSDLYDEICLKSNIASYFTVRHRSMEPDSLVSDTDITLGDILLIDICLYTLERR